MPLIGPSNTQPAYPNPEFNLRQRKNAIEGKQNSVQSRQTSKAQKVIAAETVKYQQKKAELDMFLSEEVLPARFDTKPIQSSVHYIDILRETIIKPLRLEDADLFKLNNSEEKNITLLLEDILKSFAESEHKKVLKALKAMQKKGLITIKKHELIYYQKLISVTPIGLIAVQNHVPQHVSKPSKISLWSIFSKK